jgi:hypothetical protein
MKLNMIRLAVILSACSLVSCVEEQSSDSKQQKQQEAILQEATSSVGMPAIKNFRERKLAKDILELRDQEGLTTYTYIVAEATGKLIFLGESIGYGLPYSTQFTNPEKVEWHPNRGYVQLPQADPNGLFSPASADGTWVMMKDPNGSKVVPVLVEPRCIVSPFKLSTN